MQETTCNVDSEKAVLGALLYDPSCLASLRLQAEDFSTLAHRIIFAAEGSLIQKGGIDGFLLHDALTARGQLHDAGGASYLAELTGDNIKTIGNVSHHARIVKELAERRRVKKTLTLALEGLDSPTTDLAAIKVSVARELAEHSEDRDPLEGLVSFRDRQASDLPARTWFVDGMICPGFNMITGKKGMGKSFLLMQAADAIGVGKPFLGRATTRAKVLYVSFELDPLDLRERFGPMERLSDNVFVAHSWPSGDEGLRAAERAISDGFKVLIFDTFLPMLPPPSSFEINGYGDSTLYLKWRLLGKRTGAAIVASWHEGKATRDDFMLGAIGSTGMVGQADCLISIDRKRGDTAGKLFIGGNHAAESAIPFLFENGVFSLSEGDASFERLTKDEESTIVALQLHPEGASTAAVALSMGKSEDAARKALGRLMARGRVIRPRRGVYCMPTGQPDNSGQVRSCPKGQPDRTGQHPIGVSGLSVLSGPEIGQ